jgi:hypothetical protein
MKKATIVAVAALFAAASAVAQLTPNQGAGAKNPATGITPQTAPPTKPPIPGESTVKGARTPEQKFALLTPAERTQFQADAKVLGLNPMTLLTENVDVAVKSVNVARERALSQKQAQGEAQKIKGESQDSLKQSQGQAQKIKGETVNSGTGAGAGAIAGAATQMGGKINDTNVKPKQGQEEAAWKQKVQEIDEAAKKLEVMLAKMNGQTMKSAAGK